MAVRDDFAPGEVLRAEDLNDTFGDVNDKLASKLPYSFGTATPTTTDAGFLWYDSNSTPAATKFWDGSAFVPFGGKILQVVRATDSTRRTTTSLTVIDAGISVSITPTKSDSAILLVWIAAARNNGAGTTRLVITDNADNPVSGAEDHPLGVSVSGISSVQATQSVIGYSTPATTSSVTYKGRWRTTTSQGEIQNNVTTGQLYAIEVSA